VSGSPRAEAARWLRLVRDLGVEEVPMPRGRPADSPREASSPATPPGTRPSPRPAARPLIGAAAEDAAAIDALLALGEPDLALSRLRDDVLGSCERCGLCAARTNVVFGVGDPGARLMFVGEGPGADEDAKGEPFVGRAGQLLDRIIGAMGLTRSTVYIANVVKCRPPENRNPLPGEAATCLPFLRAQIAIIRPEVIVTLGKVALQELLGERVPSITRVRGDWLDFDGIPVKVTFHPAYLLRSPSAKRPVWDDMQDVMRRLGLGPGD
jgi:DNA polymerase